MAGMLLKHLCFLCETIVMYIKSVWFWLLCVGTGTYYSLELFFSTKCDTAQIALSESPYIGIKDA